MLVIGHHENAKNSSRVILRNPFFLLSLVDANNFLPTFFNAWPSPIPY